jgi:hypothetical protein
VPFDGRVTGAMLAALRELLPMPGCCVYRPEQFAPGHWRFDVYPIPEASTQASQPESQHD